MQKIGTTQFKSWNSINTTSELSMKSANNGIKKLYFLMTLTENI